MADNTLNREFGVDGPDPFWVTDITCIRTREGFLYLAVVLDLFSRRVVGWSMQGRTYADLPLQAVHGVEGQLVAHVADGGRSRRWLRSSPAVSPFCHPG